MVVTEIGAQHATQRFFVEYNYMVQTLSANGAYYAFDECILPGGSERGPDFADTHNFELPAEFGSVDLIVIPQQILRRAVERECFHNLLCRPLGSGMGVYRY